MKPVRGLKGSVGPATLDTARDPQDITSADGISPAAGVAASQVQRVQRRDELFDDVDEPSEEFSDEPVIFGRAAALVAANKVGLADRSLDAFRSADIGALIDRLSAASAARAPQTVPAIDVLRRLKRLMDYTERRRAAARPVAGPPVARDGLKRLPPPPRPDFAPAAQPVSAQSVSTQPRSAQIGSGRAKAATAGGAKANAPSRDGASERSSGTGIKADRPGRPDKDAQ
jgi:hypothetical protein